MFNLDACFATSKFCEWVRVRMDNLKVSHEVSFIFMVFICCAAAVINHFLYIYQKNNCIVQD